MWGGLLNMVTQAQALQGAGHEAMSQFSPQNMAQQYAPQGLLDFAEQGQELFGGGQPQQQMSPAQGQQPQQQQWPQQQMPPGLLFDHPALQHNPARRFMQR